MNGVLAHLACKSQFRGFLTLLGMQELNPGVSEYRIGQNLRLHAYYTSASFMGGECKPSRTRHKQGKDRVLFCRDLDLHQIDRGR